MATLTLLNKMAANMVHCLQWLSWIFSLIVFFLCTGSVLSASRSRGGSRYSGSRYSGSRYSYRASYRASYARYSYGTSYYAMYSTYRTRPRSGGSSGGQSVCKNYEKNDNGTSLGLFTCPLPFEPRDFSSCCGSTNKEYCCQPGMSTGAIIAVCVVLVSLAVIIGSAYAYYRYRHNQRKVAPSPPPGQRLAPVPRRAPARPVQPIQNVSQNVRFRNPQNFTRVPPGRIHDPQLHQQNYAGPPPHAQGRQAQPVNNISQGVYFGNPPIQNHPQTYTGLDPPGYPPAPAALPLYSSPFTPTTGMPFPNPPPPRYGNQLQQPAPHSGYGQPYQFTGGAMPVAPPSYQDAVYDNKI